MKTIPLTQGYEAVVDDEDYDSVTRLGSWQITIHPNGRKYAVHNGRGWQILMHRFLIGEDGYDIDHKDRDGLNNVRSNLRTATRSQNNANSKTNCRNKSGYRGVSYHKQARRWEAYIGSNGRKIYLGLYDSAEEASWAYDNKARELYGEFARLNSP